MLTQFTTETQQALLQERLLAAKTPKDARRVLCLWLCTARQLPDKTVASWLGMQPRQVQRLRELYQKIGIAALDETHGGNRKGLSRREEVALLLRFFSQQHQATTIDSLLSMFEAGGQLPPEPRMVRRFLGRFGVVAATLTGPSNKKRKPQEESVTF